MSLYYSMYITKEIRRSSVKGGCLIEAPFIIVLGIIYYQINVIWSYLWPCGFKHHRCRHQMLVWFWWISLTVNDPWSPLGAEVFRPFSRWCSSRSHSCDDNLHRHCMVGRLNHKTTEPTTATTHSQSDLMLVRSEKTCHTFPTMRIKSVLPGRSVMQRPDPPENLDTKVGFLTESEFLLVSLVMLNHDSIPMLTVCISQKSLVILRKQRTQLLICPSLPYCT